MAPRDPSTTATRAERFARGWLTAGASTLVAAFSHVAGGGMQPGVLGVVLALAVAVPVSIALAGVHLSTVRLAVAVALSQVAFHLLFSLGAEGGGGASATGGHHSALVISTAADGSVSGAVAGAMVMGGPAMWLAHALAAVITIVALRRGEGAAWALVRLAVRGLAVARLLTAGHRPEVPVVRRPQTPTDVRPRPPGRRHLTARPRRGPPCPA
ncbi:hypothetical protein [Frigoribacterium sp. MCBA15_019]|uniref:hypothetical protein n=1 Tax=Frigoribacterium sp. MCBA15_019 TaxID=1898745 RepID=UPI0008DD13E4|nr:hypothetical protein [Frigoribacterium sp. MCBA15_019]OII22442.1 hypothetical protein BIV04_08885 [Frigoribacterium sp. MCBA15_019]